MVSTKTYGEILTRISQQSTFFKNNGISLGQLQPPQKELLKKIVYHQLDRMEKTVSKKPTKCLKKKTGKKSPLPGPENFEKLKAHYYRIQGKSFLIEYDNSQNNGNHIHLVWREFDGDFGRDLIREHYLNEGH